MAADRDRLDRPVGLRVDAHHDHVLGRTIHAVVARHPDAAGADHQIAGMVGPDSATTVPLAQSMRVTVRAASWLATHSDPPPTARLWGLAPVLTGWPHQPVDARVDPGHAVAATAGVGHPDRPRRDPEVQRRPTDRDGRHRAAGGQLDAGDRVLARCTEVAGGDTGGPQGPVADGDGLSIGRDP
jgi:hypothetical protein